jgi:PAS domain S-box-containing protein
LEKEPNKELDILVAALKESEERYRSVTQTSIDAILTSDDQDRILTWNSGAQHMFGYGAEIISRPVTTIIPEQYRQAHSQAVKRFLETGEKHLIGRQKELEALHHNGSIFPIELSLSTWKSDGRVYFGAIIRDISERKHLEHNREEVNRMMRHDLKSPLIGIHGLAGRMIKSPNLDDKERKSIEIIKELSDKMLNFINRSQDLIQIEEGVYELQPETVNLIHVFSAILQELEPLSQKNNTTFEFIVQGDSVDLSHDYYVSGEMLLLEIMFSNLLKNAIEASPDGSTIRVSIDPIRKQNHDYHRIDIHNQGVVPKEIRESFFEPYATSGKKSGLGLGTHSANLIARAHGGHMEFRSSTTDGTHVITILPVNPGKKD